MEFVPWLLFDIWSGILTEPVVRQKGNHWNGYLDFIVTANKMLCRALFGLCFKGENVHVSFLECHWDCQRRTRESQGGRRIPDFSQNLMLTFGSCQVQYPERLTSLPMIPSFSRAPHSFLSYFAHSDRNDSLKQNIKLDSLRGELISLNAFQGSNFSTLNFAARTREYEWSWLILLLRVLTLARMWCFSLVRKPSRHDRTEQRMQKAWNR